MDNPNVMIESDLSYLDELLSSVENIRLQNPDMPIWKLIETDPLSTQAIDSIASEGWEIKLADIPVPGICLPYLVFLASNLEGFQRDVTLFHELLHAHYGDGLNDAIGKGEKGREAYQIAELLAHKLRTDPVLLRHAVNTFQLDPQIYDAISYQAFASDWPQQANYISGQQSAFPFIEEYIDREYWERIQKIQLA